jgi:hypothetical protein
LWQIRDSLEKDVATTALKILLEYNSQGVLAGQSRVGLYMFNGI